MVASCKNRKIMKWKLVLYKKVGEAMEGGSPLASLGLGLHMRLHVRLHVRLHERFHVMLLFV